jgi:tricorn protease
MGVAVFRPRRLAENARSGGAVAALALAAALHAGAALAAPASAQDEGTGPFVRFPDVSPDGETVAFAHQGDVFRVPVDGGLATRLTVHEAYESRPRWGPEGERIAFQSDRWGGEDLFVMGADGRGVRRLTWHSADDELGGWTPDGGVLFSTRRTWAQVEWEDEIHRVSADGGTPDRRLDAVGFAPTASPDGRFVVYVAGANRRSKVGYRGPADRDLWLHDTRDGSHRRLTGYEGNDMLPEWAGDRTLLFLSDRDGGEAYNLHRLELDDDGRPSAGPEALTSYAEDGVRAFGADAAGETVVFERRTSLWRMEQGGEPRRLEVRIPEDGHFTETERRTFREQAEDYAVSPDGDRVVLVVRGDLFLIENDAEEGRTVRLTDDPHRDRDPAWASDSTLVFASDRDGDYDLYRLESADPDEPDLHRSLKQRAVRLTDTDLPERRPVVSPDGDRIAFVRANAPYATAGDAALVVADLEGGGLSGRRALLEGWAVPEGVTWSPDGRWLAYSRSDLDFNEEVFVVAADGSEGPVNVSQHPKADSDPVWSGDGSKLGFLSTRNNGDADVWFAWLREEDWERTEEDWDLLEEREEADDAGEDGGDEAAPDTVRIDLDRIHERLEQVTSLPGDESDLAVSEDGETFWFVTNRDAWREYGGDQDIWRAAWDGSEVEELTSGGEAPESLRRGPDGEHLFFLREGGSLARAGTEDGEEEGLSFAARMRIDHRAERAQIFDEAWRLLDRNFYDPDFHGEDWDALREKYRPWALAAPTKRDFRDVFNLMLGELNSSHQGLYGPDRSETHDEETGLLGVELDPVEGGVRIERVVPGSPADREESRLREGEVITAVEGTPVPEAPNFWALLADRVDRRTILAVRAPDGGEREVVVRPTDDLEDELYDEWVERRRELTGEYSDGRLGYIHVEGMNWPSFERFERELEAAADGKEGLLVDVRFNGGGWTTDYLLTVLTYPQHAYTVPRGATSDPGEEHGRFRDHYPFGERLPQAWWTKPVAALANQNSYSNAEIFSHAFRTLDLGPLVGEPTFGAVISTGGAGLVDGSFVRIPFRGWYVRATDENMEHGPAVPDHRVPRRPDDRAGEGDDQLREAVDVLLERIDRE